ncbi:MAG: folylpolyglutamate synthase/dihydrofolate synthase family protein [Nanoarchaeota archaeon]
MFTHYKDALNYIFNLKRYNQAPTFDSLHKALSTFANPHLNKRIVHITGTNGKGSCAAMMANILYAAGYKVGLFTSPHLVRFEERIQIDGNLISAESVLEYINKIKNIELQLTFFEYCTIMAFLYFHEQQCEWIVLEAGMGGRHDPTNICMPKVCIITNVDLDHIDILGRTIADIAADKAGIIKEGVPVVTGATGEAKKIIFETAISTKSMLVSGEQYDYDVGLLGEHQIMNAGLAYEAARLLEIPNELIRKGIKEVKWPGRLEYAKTNLLLDCAHNPAGISALSKYLQTIKKPMIIIFGSIKTKDYTNMLRLLPQCMECIVTSADKNKGVLPEELSQIRSCTIKSDPIIALGYATSIAGSEDLIVICGSCYLIGTVKVALNSGYNKN